MAAGARHGHRARRLPRAGVAAPREGLSLLRRRADAARDAVRGGPRAVRAAREGGLRRARGARRGARPSRRPRAPAPDGRAGRRRLGRRSTAARRCASRRGRRPSPERRVRLHGRPHGRHHLPARGRRRGGHSRSTSSPTRRGRGRRGRSRRSGRHPDAGLASLSLAALVGWLIGGTRAGSVGYESIDRDGEAPARRSGGAPSERTNGHARHEAVHKAKQLGGVVPETS